MSWLSNLFSGGSKPQTVPTPEYYENPLYGSQQSYLGDYSKRLLEGDIPEYYKWMGQPQSQQARSAFQEASQGLIGADQENRAAIGRGREGLSADTMGALGNMSALYQFLDMNRAMQGAEDLLGLGSGMGTNVRDSAYQQQVDRNQYNQWKYNADQSIQQYLNQARDARQTKQTGAIAGAALGLFNPFAGMGFLPSALVGAGLGSTAGGLVSGTPTIGGAQIGGLSGGDVVSTLGSIAGGGSKGGVDFSKILENILGGGKGIISNPSASTQANQEQTLSPLSGYGSITGQGSDELVKKFLELSGGGSNIAAGMSLL